MWGGIGIAIDQMELIGIGIDKMELTPYLVSPIWHIGAANHKPCQNAAVW